MKCPAVGVRVSYERMKVFFIPLKIINIYLIFTTNVTFSTHIIKEKLQKETLQVDTGSKLMLLTDRLRG